MQFDHNTKNASYERQHGQCTKCGKYLNLILEDGPGFEGAWTAHDLLALEEGGSNKAHSCVILSISKPDCHISFAHGGDLKQGVFLTPFAFPNWVFQGSQEEPSADAKDRQRG